jgi:hypothetical protein
MVVLTSLCPSSSWIVRMSWPRSSRCVANEWRKVWQLAAFVTPASGTARFTAFCTTLGIEMVAALSTGFPVAPAVLLGEYPLSGPLPACLRVVLRHTSPMHASVSDGKASSSRVGIDGPGRTGMAPNLESDRLSQAIYRSHP